MKKKDPTSLILGTLLLLYALFSAGNWFIYFNPPLEETVQINTSMLYYFKAIFLILVLAFAIHFLSGVKTAFGKTFWLILIFEICTRRVWFFLSNDYSLSVSHLLAAIEFTVFSILFLCLFIWQKKCGFSAFNFEGKRGLRFT